MDGFLNQTLLEHPEAFHAYDHVYGIELWRSPDLAKPFVRHGDITMDDFSHWLRQEARYTQPPAVGGNVHVECLRILACKSTRALRNWGHTGVPGTGAPALSMSRAQYEDARRCLGLPEGLLSIMARQTAAWTRSAGGFMLKTNSSRTWHYGMACAFDPANSTTNVFLLGLEEPQMTAVCQCLEHEDMSLPLPTLLPVLLLDLRAEATLQHISHSHTNIFHLEGETGVFSASKLQDPVRELGLRVSASGAIVGPRIRTSVDYENVTVELTSTITELSHALFTCEVNARMLEDLPQLLAGLLHAPRETAPQVVAALQRFHDKIAHLKTHYRGLESRAQYVMRRAQAQVQTVYSMVAQRDSAASAALAEASRQDSILMRKVAEDSKRVAVATSRDSASMRVIAAVTILFLPATFVATLFSTSFFDFQQAGRVVSAWIWLYWVVTVALTVSIHAAWYVVSRRKEREIERRFGDRSGRETPETSTQRMK